ncbi:MAG: dephospho-CoA kinase [Sphaerospermopsis sp.]|uniref:dephospho-CoA kinase n=1 Tax=Sphaerospermopsis sp. LEGE 00249 TaxID=1380707 RepID=UPI00164D4A64|nr:dephospho-CoA kinase [Sphaerospermopsis sp. LEGE 00249]MBC5794717.1 dephospho-CoA kinase [Sphaerospermopsis sp. LEGE 00249]MEB3151309.1 dephospho-CoA kinase [Sphaerospermopsis sp.]
MTKRLIGLTGGIATGKSTVANYLANTYNLPILDADVYARNAVSVGSPILSQITQRYGKSEILLADGNLNRAKLGEIIFHQPEERIWVENVIHPYVRNWFLKTIHESSATTLVLVIPLLFEAGLENLVSEIWVVSCSEAQQKQRLIQRNNLTNEQAAARINSQLPLSEKIARADVVLDNSSTLESLLQQIDKVMKI